MFQIKVSLGMRAADSSEPEEENRDSKGDI
jgi:hypothetical protein